MNRNPKNYETKVIELTEEHKIPTKERKPRRVGKFNQCFLDFMALKENQGLTISITEFPKRQNILSLVYSLRKMAKVHNADIDYNIKEGNLILYKKKQTIAPCFHPQL